MQDRILAALIEHFPHVHSRLKAIVCEEDDSGKLSVTKIAELMEYYCKSVPIDPKSIIGTGLYGQMKDHRYKALAIALCVFQPEKLDKPDIRLKENLAEQLRSYFNITSDILSKNVSTAIALYRISVRYKSSYAKEINELIKNYMQSH